MVGPIHGAQRVDVSGRHEPSATASTVVDSYVPSSAPSGRLTFMRRAAVVALMMAAGAITGSAEEVAPQQMPMGQCWTQGQLIEGSCSEHYSRLGGEGQQLYHAMPLGLKSWFAENVNGRAGPLGIVNKREAFINGTWAGFDVFSFVNGRLDKKLQEAAAQGEVKRDKDVKGDKRLSPAEIERGKAINDTCRKLTVQQRRDFVEMLDLDTGRKK